MVFRDQRKKKNLFWKYVRYETLEEYRSGINHLLSNGIQVKGIVCDGKRGLFTAFGGIPVQMCQFHQVAIITRYITRNPKLQAGKELKEIVHQLTTSDKAEFQAMLTKWHHRWKEFLAEKTYNEMTGEWQYTHRRLRSAYRSLRSNLQYLFTCKDYPDRDIPNTTNSLEGTFSKLKTKLRIHTGVRDKRKRKIVDQILSE